MTEDPPQVHFSEEIDVPVASYRKLDSPPPPPEARLSPAMISSARNVVDDLLQENEADVGTGNRVRFAVVKPDEDSTPVVAPVSPHAVRFPEPKTGDLLKDHDGPHRNLESPPPPMESQSLAPAIVPTALPDEVVVYPANDREDDSDFGAPPSSLLTPLKPSLSSSIRSSHGSAGSTGTPKFVSKQLRGNLTRTQLNRDPLTYYEVTAVLGVGSMGSVAKVRKRQSAIGGSARKNVLDEIKPTKKKMHTCFDLPFVGGLFRHCTKGEVDAESENDTSSAHSSEWLIASEGSNALASDDMVYAMKSIHISRCTDEVFIEELKNEIEILKTLDHPHIVRAIETFEHRHQLFVIMEICSGGDLYSRDPYLEEEAARITSSILSAIWYMHSRGM